MKFLPLVFFILTLTPLVKTQHEHHSIPEEGQLPIITGVEPQPFLSQAERVAEALTFMGSALPEELIATLHTLKSEPLNEKTVVKIQELLDPYCIAMIDINPESRVKALRGPATARMIQDGWTTYLVKVHNQAHITPKLIAESPNALPVLHVSTGKHRMKAQNYISPGELDDRFVEIAIYRDRPLQAHLSGLGLEYVPIQFYTRVTGKREVLLDFNVGQGTQDIGFRSRISILFDVKPSVKVIFRVVDTDGQPAMASFIITDGIERFEESAFQRWGENYRINMAQTQHWQEGMQTVENPDKDLPAEKRLSGIFPLPGRRLATKDAFPDFFFQPQIYRTDGEYVYLPPGTYHITYGRGPEYLTKYRRLQVPGDIDSMVLDIQLERWIHMAQKGWYSADHHIHAAGCSHYESPSEGVLPEHMWRQVVGEDLNMGNNLTWGPSWYYQKQFFTGDNHPLSDENNIMRYDVEVSGFPSSHAGHLVLLNLKEDDYPDTEVIEDWPSWTLPVLEWAKGQNGITGYAHSGWGLAPIDPTDELPNYVLPKMDGIGANEYVVTVTHDMIDFYSLGDTPLTYELNMWYHTLNSGFRVPASGETDFPCISDERVGRTRIYAKLDRELDFDAYMDALVHGKSYVSDGYSHLIDFMAANLELGEQESELKISGKQVIEINAKAAAYLSDKQDVVGAIIAGKDPAQSPYWHIERARIGTSRKVAVELIVNGYPADTLEINADGTWNDLTFTYEIDRSSWLALRILGSSHTNPIFVLINEQPIRIKKSIEWCRAAVDRCWEMKKGRIRAEELEAARNGYDHAREVYDRLLQEY